MEINFIAVLLAAVASFVFGAIWYSPVLFMRRWCQETGVNPSESIDNPARVYGTTFLMNLISAFVLSLLLGPGPDISIAILYACLISVGMIAASMGINYQFAQRSLMHWLIDSGFHLGRFVLMATVLSFWG